MTTAVMRTCAGRDVRKEAFFDRNAPIYPPKAWCVLEYDANAVSEIDHGEDAEIMRLLLRGKGRLFA